MADADYRTWVEVLPDFKNFNSTVQNTVIGGLGSAGTSGSDAMGTSLVAGVGKFAGPIAAAIAALGIASAITGAVKSGFDAAVDYVRGSVDLASEMQQSAGAVEAVFKENAAEIESWAGASSQNVGLAKGDYLSFASVVGAQLKNLGIPFDDLTGRTDGLITLAADLAAQFGGDTSSAVTALSALLRGERDPIERYGVSIKEADVQAQKATMGLSGLTGEADKQAGILATLEILSRQTADAQGAFARESDTFANVQQRLNAEWEDAQARLGEKLLPILTEVMNFVADELLPIWEDFIEQAGPELASAFEEIWPYLKDLITGLLPALVEGIPLVILAFQYLATQVEAAIAPFAGVMEIAEALGQLLNGEITFEEFVNRVWEQVGRVWGAFETARDKVLEIVMYIPNRIAEIFGGADLASSGRALMQGFLDGINSMFKPIGDAVGGLMDWVAGFFPNSPAKHGPFSGTGWTAVLKSGSAIMSAFESGLRRVDVPLGMAGVGLGFAPSMASTARDVNVTQNITIHSDDPRLAARQMGREAQGALSAS